MRSNKLAVLVILRSEDDVRELDITETLEESVRNESEALESTGKADDNSAVLCAFNAIDGKSVFVEDCGNSARREEGDGGSLYQFAILVDVEAAGRRIRNVVLSVLTSSTSITRSTRLTLITLVTLVALVTLVTLGTESIVVGLLTVLVPVTV